MIETSEAIRTARALIGTPYSELDCINLIKMCIRDRCWVSAHTAAVVAAAAEAGSAARRAAEAAEATAARAARTA